MLSLNRIVVVTSLALACAVTAPQALAQKGGGNKGGSGTTGGGTVSPGSHPTSGPNAGPGFGLPSNNGNYGPYSPYGGRVYDPGFGTLRPMTPEEDRLHRAMEKQRNLERRKAMLADTDRLVQLTNSIQSDLQSADGKVSPATAKKASEAEKLAKSVQRKMTGDN